MPFAHQEHGVSCEDFRINASYQNKTRYTFTFCTCPANLSTLMSQRKLISNDLISVKMIVNRDKVSATTMKTECYTDKNQIPCAHLIRTPFKPGTDILRRTYSFFTNLSIHFAYDQFEYGIRVGMFRWNRNS